MLQSIQTCTRFGGKSHRAERRLAAGFKKATTKLLEPPPGRPLDSPGGATRVSQAPEGVSVELAGPLIHAIELWQASY